MISQFKAGLGLEDEDAAGVHIEIGRRIFRQRMETGDKGAAIEERKTFQKLVYVSDLVFGPKAKFLLPWKRIFKVSDAQVDVAVRTNAQELFQSKLEESRAEPDVAVLKELRAQQKKFKLPDEVRGTPQYTFFFLTLFFFTTAKDCSTCRTCCASGAGDAKA